MASGKISHIRLLISLAGLAILVGIFLPFSLAIYYGAKTIHDLLSENKELKKAVANLTREDQIGYAKVIGQEKRDGKLFTRLKFVETARDNKLKKILEKECEIEGDIVHFDALIVTFDTRMVMDGKERALYLWRRIYGESQPPQNGFAIESSGNEPARYKDLLSKLPLKDRRLFWAAVWDLANDPEKLQRYGLRAVYGNAVYHKLQKGLIYVFKISPTGQVYPEVVPEI